jgi:hypothetical protein
VSAAEKIDAVEITTFTAIHRANILTATEYASLSRSVTFMKMFQEVLGEGALLPLSRDTFVKGHTGRLYVVGLFVLMAENMKAGRNCRLSAAEGILSAAHAANLRQLLKDFSLYQSARG